MDVSPLFVTRLSLSGKTALGVVTRRFVEGTPNARHVYWEDVEFARPSGNALRLERPLAARFALLKRPGVIRRLADGLGLRRWRDQALPADLAAKVRALGTSTSVVYVAPVSGDDATRMRHIVELVGRPFVLHVWDMLDGGPDTKPDLAWLGANADKIYAVSPEMGAAFGVTDVPLLIFSRPDTPLRAKCPVSGQALRIGLIGDISSYTPGMTDLVAANALLRAQGIVVEWLYIGPKKVVRRMPAEVRAIVCATGFLTGAAARDAALANCHLAFLPGPSEAPSDDLRSRFSVPSRTLDFGAVGLPVVGMVHPHSATANVAAELAPTMCAVDPEALAAMITRLAAPTEWRTAAAASRSYFERIIARRPVETLAADLADYAAKARSHDAGTFDAAVGSINHRLRNRRNGV